MVCLGLSSPALAQTSPPSDITVRLVKVGDLEKPNFVTLFNPDNSSKQIKVELSGCQEGWNAGELFMLIRARDGSFYLIRGARFIHYYEGEANKMWNKTVNLITRDQALCSVNIAK